MRTSASTLFSVLALAIGLVESASSQTIPKGVPCKVHHASPRTQKAIFEAYVKAMYIEKNIPKAFNNVVAADYIQHNPAGPDGFDAAYVGLSQLLANPELEVQILHLAFEAPYGWVHLRMDGFQPNATAGLDLYRMNGTCFQEHWDVLQERPATALNDHPLF
ncbi:Snoal-like polyketide cyclase family protein [Favolaschia claudopus]|uniref:Snoal-like polyketide cyclase family protein n=1 Tax=Favolaschia claudopus TaxID=2862362 RepID=A0AAW0CLW3_9AGAR